MKNIVKVIFVAISIGFLVYLALPEPDFPDTLWDFKASTEPADKESPLRRGYFTNLTREQLMSHYSKEFKWGERLNYPPEEAQTIIRDQTKSTFLEEIVHPMRESLFVNGYEPSPEKETFSVDGESYKQKIIVKYVTSNISIRLFIGILSVALMWILGKEWFTTIKKIKWIYR